MTLRARVALSAGLATAAVAVVFAIAGVLVTRSELRHELDRELVREVSAAAPRARRAVLFEDGVVPVDETDRRQSERSSRILDENGNILAESTNRNVEITDGDKAVAAGRSAVELRNATGRDGESYRVVTAGLGDVGGRQLAVQIARSTDEIERSISRLTVIFGICGLAGSMLAVAAAWLVAHTAVAPVNRLADAAAEVADTQNLSVSVPEDGGHELAKLGGSFNRMLRALESSRAQQQRLVADAGHELRTPLTSLRTNVEVLSTTAVLSEADRTAIMADIGAQVEELTALVADLSELARDEEAGELEFTDVRLDVVAESALTRARRRANGVRIESSLEPMIVHGHEALLERAILNVLDNAIKWSPPGGVVRVMLRGGALTITDEGPGIDPGDRDRVFERFWRAPSARAQRGSGLGLAIVHQVVSSHHGSVRITDGPGAASPGPDGSADRGTTVTIVLPRLSPETHRNLPSNA